MRLIFLFLLLPFSLLAQDMTGVWVGQIQTGESEVRYELVISQQAKGLKGYVMMTFLSNGVENTGVKLVEIKQKDREIFLEDGDLIYNNYTTPPKKAKLYATLTLKEKPAETLWGTFKTRSLDMRVRESYSGQIQLKRQENLAASLLLPRLKDLDLLNTVSFIPAQERREQSVASTTAKKDPAVAKPAPQATESTVAVTEKEPEAVERSRTHKAELVENGARKPIDALSKDKLAVKTTDAGALKNYVSPAARMRQRQTETIQELLFDEDSVVVTLYDNGEIDGDSVSIFLNGVPVLLNQKLTTKPITTVIRFDPGKTDSVHLVMFAENLGSIPPNTGLLLLQDNKGRKEVRFSCNLQKNAGIVLRRKRAI